LNVERGITIPPRRRHKKPPTFFQNGGESFSE